MAAVTAIAVTNRSPKGVTITITGADYTNYTLKQLAAVVNKCLVECSGEFPETTGTATVSGI